MPDTSRDTVRSTESYGPLIVLLALSVVINYIDRSNLAIAAPLLRTEIGLSASQLGLLLSAFFWTYATFQLLAGWMADRYRAAIVLAAGFALWSLTTALTAAVNGLAALFLVRFLLGVGESVAFPCYSKILAQYLPRRGAASPMPRLPPVWRTDRRSACSAAVCSWPGSAGGRSSSRWGLGDCCG